MWQFADYEQQTTAAAKAARLAQHITEVSQFIANERASGGSSMGSGSLVQYMDQLRRRRSELQLEAEGEAGGSLTFPCLG